MRLKQDYAFGRASGSGPVASSWEAASSDADRVRFALASAERGEFAFWPKLLESLADGIEDADAAIDAQLLLMSTARSSDVQDPRLLQYASTIQDTELFTFASSGSRLLAASSLPIYLGLAQAFSEHRDDFFLAATYSVYSLTAVDFDELDEELTVEAWGPDAIAAIADAGAPYVAGGAALAAAPVAKRLTAHAMRSEATGQPFDGVVEADQLATWSGITFPVAGDRRPLTKADVKAVVEYALTLSKLPWRDGVKYFYGHDVDGGPGLHDAPTA